MKNAKDRVSIKDIAALAGVSIGTVSRVINKKSDVGPDAVRKVTAAIRELNYTPNPIASNLARKHKLDAPYPSRFKTGVVGFLSIGMDQSRYLQDEFYARFLTGVESVCASHGLDMLFSSSEGNFERGEMPKMVAKGQVDGVIIKSSGLLPKAWIESLASMIPCVLLSARYESPLLTVSSVMGDNKAAIRKAMRYLHGLGHERIGFLNVRDLPLSTNFDHDQRQESYLEASKAMGLPQGEGFLQSPTRDHSTQSLDDVLSQALEAWLSLGDARPTAVCCSTDIYAIALSKLAKGKGLRVPEDLSMTGFMNINAAALNEPPITTLSLPSGEMGRAAASLLIEAVANPSMPPRNVMIDCPLVERLSCARI